MLLSRTIDIILFCSFVLITMNTSDVGGEVATFEDGGELFQQKWAQDRAFECNAHQQLPNPL